jgi:hypothetical protein
MNKDDISKWIHMAWDFTNEENVKRKFEYQEAHRTCRMRSLPS